MALILNIDTSTEIASVCIAKNGSSLAYRENKQQREHASFVHNAIEIILIETGLALKNIDAFAITAGPGSYTGLRVGMATAKGFCYAFSKPLISINTLIVMAKAAVETINEMLPSTLLCPMIDARRMEVFTAIYDIGLHIIKLPAPLIVDENIFDEYLLKGKVLFFGSGSNKFQSLIETGNALFAHVSTNAKHLAMQAEEAYQQKRFSNISYSEPEYFKEFYSLAKN